MKKFSKKKIMIVVTILLIGFIAGGVAVGFKVYKDVGGNNSTVAEILPPLESLSSGDTTGIGVATDEFGAFDINISDDESLYLIGDNRKAGAQDFRLVKLDANLRLVKNFSTEGIVEVDFGGSNETAFSMIKSEDGKILTAGLTNVNGDLDFAFVRFDSNGNLDESFGNFGKVVVDFDGRDDGAYKVVELSDGRMLAGGFANGPNAGDFALLALNSDGSLDESFGDSGKVTIDFGQREEYIGSLFVLEDGDIIAVGNARKGRIALARLTSDGILDSNFGEGGKVAVAVEGGTKSVVIDDLGRIIVGGWSLDGLLLMRFLANGDLDTSFGNRGKVSERLGDAIALALDRNGKIFVAGEANLGTGADLDIILSRYTEEGNLDESFGDNGRLVFDFDSSHNTVAGLKINPNGKILVGVTTQKDGFTKHGVISISDEKTVADIKFNLDEEPPKDIKPK